MSAGSPRLMCQPGVPVVTAAKIGDRDADVDLLARLRRLHRGITLVELHSSCDTCKPTARVFTGTKAVTATGPSC
ncbi:hypothetical protein ACFUTV_25440 [Streptomyces sp. NPDC057298]|uniref:hypothetical protein n=1 Tax=Streptomyces sp. NPDC057298 TaxID=3346091 RepID=UPI003644D4C9